jgi:hypothetical protein
MVDTYAITKHRKLRIIYVQANLKKFMLMINRANQHETIGAGTIANRSIKYVMKSSVLKSNVGTVFQQSLKF